jgi:peptide/nickel transport system ATP-binding protein/glutathione transport system ATP-binding protein
VPIPDPRQRRLHDDSAFRAVPSPVFPIRHAAAPSTYDQVSPGHFVLEQP